MKAYQGAAAAWGGLADLVFPRTCLSCGSVPDTGLFRHLCAACAVRIDYVSAPSCSTCGHPFFGEVIGERLCPHCTGLAPTYRQGCTAVLCKGPARTLIHELKYRRGLYALEDIEAIFRRSARVLNFVRDAILVPIPLHGRKLRERGYNQSQLLAEALARAARGRTRIEHLLLRSIDTESQTGFDRPTRLANLKNAFALVEGASIVPKLHYVLVDDVFTTGATLNSSAGVLHHAGCLNLDVVTFGHG